MREIDKDDFINTIRDMCINNSYCVSTDMMQSIENKINSETSVLGKKILKEIYDNNEYAKQNNVPACQDTGISVFFIEIGNQIKLNFNLTDAVNEGVKLGYKEGYLRKSIVKSPLNRENTNDNTPAIIHEKIVEGDKIKIKYAPKGAGSENMSQLKMMNPSSSVKDIKEFIKTVIVEAGGKACPPLIVGVGIGGNFELAPKLAKEAILRDITDKSTDIDVSKLEEELLEEINKLKIGPMGLGGNTTAISVKINTYPCHIASLPVAVNLQCHCSRHSEVII